MRKIAFPHIFFYLIFLSVSRSLSSSINYDKPLFFVNPTVHYFFGENLELLNNHQPYDQYSFVQYIIDFGTNYTQHLSQISEDLLSLTLTFRMKGNLGNAGRYNIAHSVPLKIGWATTGTIETSSSDFFAFWMRELTIAYKPETVSIPLFTFGLFPFKLGNGLALGNAYKLDQPIPGQFIYEQIDQFRPGFLLSFKNNKQNVAGDIYLGILASKADWFENTALETNSQALSQVLDERGPGKMETVFAFQLNCSASRNKAKFLCNPYLFIDHNSNQQVEFPGDATSTLITPGICLTFEREGIRASVEFAKNLGHQSVLAWDRNQLFQANTLYNSYLFYAPDTALTLQTVTNADFTFSPLVILPNTFARAYENGENFLYAPTAGNNPFIFKNAYNRFRNAYKNNYTGWLAYFDFIAKENHWSVALATGFASGADNPNDATDTLLMTRLTPGIPQLDYNKKYHGFVSVNQLFEGKSINPLYFGQAQKLNRPLTDTNQLTTPIFTNQGFAGITIRYTSETEKRLSADATAVAYFQLAPIKKGLTANLWQLQSLDFTPQMQADLNTTLPNFLGTELNASFTYSRSPHFIFSLLTAIFIPGSFYTGAAGKGITLAEQARLALPSFVPDEIATPPSLGTNTCFYINVTLTCLFDFAEFTCFKHHKTKELA